MQTEFHIDSTELNIEFLEKIKSLFMGSKRLAITIEQEVDDT